jgi:hypothetical protein
MVTLAMIASEGFGSRVGDLSVSAELGNGDV